MCHTFSSVFSQLNSFHFALLTWMNAHCEITHIQTYLKLFIQTGLSLQIFMLIFPCNNNFNSCPWKKPAFQNKFNKTISRAVLFFNNHWNPWITPDWQTPSTFLLAGCAVLALDYPAWQYISIVCASISKAWIPRLSFVEDSKHSILSWVELWKRLNIATVALLCLEHSNTFYVRLTPLKCSWLADR